MSSEQQHGVVFPRSARTAGGARRRSAARWWPTRCGWSTRPGPGPPSRRRTGGRTTSCTSAGGRGRAWTHGPRRCRSRPTGWPSLHDRMRVPGGRRRTSPWPTGLDDPLATAKVRGTGEAETEFSLPYRGERLRGDALRAAARRLGRRRRDRAVRAPRRSGRCGTPRSGCALPGRTVAVLGAGAEMGPLTGAAAVGRPRGRASTCPGRRCGSACSTTAGPAPARCWSRSPPDSTGRRACRRRRRPARRRARGRGLAGRARRPAGAGQLRLRRRRHATCGCPPAVDALSTRAGRRRADDLALAFLATPTDVFAVPAEAVAQSTAGYDGRSTRAKAARPAAAHGQRRAAAARATTRPAPTPASTTAWSPQQGPNYALAKRLQRWRATVARDAGTTVSLHVAPADPDPRRGEEPRCWRRRTPAPTGSASRSSSRPPATC